GLGELSVSSTATVRAPVHVTIRLPGHTHGTCFVGPGATKGVWHTWATSAGVLEPHVAFEVVGVNFVDRAVHRRLLEVGANTVALRVCVGEVTTKQHLVW